MDGFSQPLRITLTFSFIQITDHHLGESDADNPYGYPAALTFRAVLDHIASHHRQQVDFIVSTGDLVNRPTATAYDFFKRILDLKTAASLSEPHRIHYGSLHDFPIYLLPGNHDERTAFFANLFPGQNGANRLNASFVHQGVRFLLLDWGPGDRGELSPELLGFVEQNLLPDEPAILMMHHNVVPVGAPWLDRFIAEDIEQFHQILHGKNILAILCGHLHSSYERDWEGIPVLGLRSTAFQFRFEGKPVVALQPPHYRLVTIEGDRRLKSRVVEVPLPAGLRAG
jgi:Icc protein